MIRLCLVLLALIVAPTVFGGNVTIKGEAKGYEGGTISLLVYPDAISNLGNQLAQSEVDENGDFYFNVSITEIVYAQLRVDWVNAGIYLKPNSFYEVILPRTTEQLVSINNKTRVALTFSSLPALDPNRLISAFNSTLDSEMEAVFSRTVLGDFNASFGGLKRKLKSQFDSIDDPFFRETQEFLLGSIEAELSLNPKSVFERYLQGKSSYPVANPAFGKFMKTFFSDFLHEIDQFRGENTLKKAVETRVPAYRFRAMVGEHDFLKDPQLCELVALWGLFESGQKHQWNSILVGSMMEQIGRESRFETTRMLARNLLTKWSSVEKGFSIEIPYSVGVDGTKLQPNPKDFDLTLLCFGIASSEDLLRDLIILKDLALRFPNRVQIQFISVDKRKSDFKKFASAQFNLGIPMGHYDFQEDLIEQLDLRSIPKYILLNKEGKKVVRHEPRPLEGLDIVINKYLFTRK